MAKAQAAHLATTWSTVPSKPSASVSLAIAGAESWAFGDSVGGASLLQLAPQANEMTAAPWTNHARCRTTCRQRKAQVRGFGADESRKFRMSSLPGRVSIRITPLFLRKARFVKQGNAASLESKADARWQLTERNEKSLLRPINKGNFFRIALETDNVFPTMLTGSLGTFIIYVFKKGERHAFHPKSASPKDVRHRLFGRHAAAIWLV